jgi:DMSO/TMAO reductase YedYZ molybdopterin-dependent catalytic subunit
LAHATGLIDQLPGLIGISLTVMQVHVGAGLLALAALVAHFRRHPVRPKAVDLHRRALLGAAGVIAVSTVAWAGYERALAVTRLPGGDRRFTGSVERSSGVPAGLPVYSWIDDRTPSVDAQQWRMAVLDRPVGLADLSGLPQESVEAVLDCTGGWFSRQVWSGVRLDRVLAELAGPLPRGTRSIEVLSSTGFSRRFPVADLDRVWLATGVGGRPLSAGHGFPARIVAPDRRGFWWVKWVVAVRADSRPWWTQPPFPLT